MKNKQIIDIIKKNQDFEYRLNLCNSMTSLKDIDVHLYEKAKADYKKIKKEYDQWLEMES